MEKFFAPAAPETTLSIAPSNFLARLDTADRSALTAMARQRRYDKGQRVFSTGCPGEHVYFLVDGKIKIGQTSPSGREVILWFCFPGEIFGLAEVAHGGGRTVGAEACADSHVLTVSQGEFKAFLEQRPVAAMLSMQVLASRLRVLGEMFANLVADDAGTRIAKLILRLGARYGKRSGNGEILLNIPLTHQEIADMVGTTRQTVTSTLAQLRRQGVLSIDNRRILIESEDLLSEITLATPGSRE